MLLKVDLIASEACLANQLKQKLKIKQCIANGLLKFSHPTAFI